MEKGHGTRRTEGEESGPFDGAFVGSRGALRFATKIVALPRPLLSLFLSRSPRRVICCEFINATLARSTIERARRFGPLGPRDGIRHTCVFNRPSEFSSRPRCRPFYWPIYDTGKFLARLSSSTDTRRSSFRDSSRIPNRAKSNHATIYFLSSNHSRYPVTRVMLECDEIEDRDSFQIKTVNPSDARNDLNTQRLHKP